MDAILQVSQSVRQFFPWTTGPYVLPLNTCFSVLPPTAPRKLPHWQLSLFQLMRPWDSSIAQYSTKACQFGLLLSFFTTSLKAFLLSLQQAISTFLANKNFLTSVSFSGINTPKFEISVSKYALAMTWTTFNLPVHVERSLSDRDSFREGNISQVLSVAGEFKSSDTRNYLPKAILVISESEENIVHTE